MALPPIGLPEKFGVLVPLKPGQVTPEVEGAPATRGGFAKQLRDFVVDVNEAQRVADEKAVSMANGTNNDLHGTMIALEQADIKLRLLTTVRNKAIEAYRQMMRMGS